jgi:uncharacterized protein YrrD
MQIDIGARVRTRDQGDVGEVHRVVVDVDREEVVSIVVLKGRWLSRDILVPLAYVERADADGVALSLVTDELEQLPDFVYNEFVTPPPTWTFPMPYPGGAVYVPMAQRERLGGNEVDLTPGTRVLATDGDLGSVDQIEIDSASGRLDAFWVKRGGLFPHDLRIPAEWVTRLDADGVHLGASCEEAATRLRVDGQARGDR